VPRFTFSTSLYRSGFFFAVLTSLIFQGEVMATECLALLVINGKMVDTNIRMGVRFVRYTQHTLSYTLLSGEEEDYLMIDDSSFTVTPTSREALEYMEKKGWITESPKSQS
jgi:hypothetical protein